MNKKKIICITAGILAVAVALTSVAILTREKADYTLLDEFSDEKAVYTDKALSDGDTVDLGQTENLSLEYQRENNIFYIKSKNGRAVYSTGVERKYYEGALFDGARYPLCQVGFTDFGGNSDSFSSADTAFTVTERSIKNGISLELYFTDYELGFTLEVWLNKYGLKAAIPESSIKEDGIYGITTVAVFPMLGAVKDGKASYAVYPDGSGSLCKFDGSSKPESPVITNMYFDTTFDLDSVAESRRLGELNAMLPIYGLCRGDTAVAAYVTEGDTSSFITLTPSTKTFGLNRCYMSCRYRKQYSYISPTEVEINEVERNRSAGDFSVQYIFLEKSDKEITYGNMATALREFMLETKRLTATDTEARVNLQLIMGTKQSSSMSSSYRVMTDFEQVKAIADEIGVDYSKDLRLFLLGWQKNGYGLNPAGDKASGKLGGTSGLRELYSWSRDRDINMYLVNDYVYAQNGGSGFNKSSDAAYNEAQQPFGNSDTTEFLLNPLFELKKLISKRLDYFGDISATGIAFDKMGSWLYDDYRSEAALNRNQSALALSSMLKSVKEQKMYAAVQSGNAYVLRYADYIYDLPETNSEHSGFSQAIPFYQMIVHASIGYCGTVPGNMASDYNKQKLKWIEYGSSPYFVLTYNSSELLRDTYLTEAFATEYSVWVDRIRKCIDEFNTKLSFMSTSTISEHKAFNNDTVKVVYSGGHTVYINYSRKPVTVEGVSLEAESYTVTEGGNAK